MILLIIATVIFIAIYIMMSYFVDRDMEIALKRIDDTIEKTNKMIANSNRTLNEKGKL